MQTQRRSQEIMVDCVCEVSRRGKKIKTKRYAQKKRRKREGGSRIKWKVEIIKGENGEIWICLCSGEKTREKEKEKKRKHMDERKEKNKK